jgi:hypothetical protein
MGIACMDSARKINVSLQPQLPYEHHSSNGRFFFDFRKPIRDVYSTMDWIDCDVSLYQKKNPPFPAK